MHMCCKYSTFLCAVHVLPACIVDNIRTSLLSFHFETTISLLLYATLQQHQVVLMQHCHNIAIWVTAFVASICSMWIVVLGFVGIHICIIFNIILFIVTISITVITSKPSSADRSNCRKTSSTLNRLCDAIFLYYNNDDAYSTRPGIFNYI